MKSIKDVTTPEELASVAASMRCCAADDDAGPEVSAALILAAEKIEHFVAVATECVAEIEGAIDRLLSAWDRSALH